MKSNHFRTLSHLRNQKSTGFLPSIFLTALFFSFLIGNAQINVTSSGLVGIGTTPTLNLDVRSSGTSTGGYLGLANSDGTKYIGMYNGANTNEHQAIYWTAGQDLKLAVATNYSTAGWTELVRIKSNGRFGIGTNDPVSILDVGNHATTSNNANIARVTGRWVSTDGNFAHLRLSNSDDAGGSYFGVVARREINNWGVSVDFTVNNTGAAATPLTAMTLRYDGNVGIGNNNPSDVLDVNGNIASQYAGNFTNSGNNANRYGIKVTAGENNGVTSGNDNWFFRAYDGNGNFRGGLRSNNNTFSLFSNSDIRLKTNITDTKLNAQDIINKLRVVDYNWKDAPLGNLTHGFIAQECQKVYPDMVGYGSGDTLGISLEYLIPLLVKAQQTQQKKTDSLTAISNKQNSKIDSINVFTSKPQNSNIDKIQDSIVKILIYRIDSLTTIVTQISDCCNRNMKKMDDENINNRASSNISSILYQNIPNPFSQQTSIQYFIPTTAQSASIMVFDLNGKLMKTTSISNYGSGTIIINGHELNPGMFVYSLIVDGKIIDTKRMILTQ